MADEISPNSLPAPSFMNNNPLQAATPFAPAPVVSKEKAAEAQRFAYAPDQAKQGLDIGVARRTEDAQRTYKVIQNQQTQAILEEGKRVDQQIATEEAQISQVRGEIESIRQQIAQAQAAAAEAQRRAAELQAQVSSLQAQASSSSALPSTKVTGFNIGRARDLELLPEFQRKIQEAYDSNIAGFYNNYLYQQGNNPQGRTMSFEEFKKNNTGTYDSDYVRRSVEERRRELMSGWD